MYVDHPGCVRPKSKTETCQNKGAYQRQDVWKTPADTDHKIPGVVDVDNPECVAQLGWGHSRQKVTQRHVYDSIRLSWLSRTRPYNPEDTDPEVPGVVDVDVDHPGRVRRGDGDRDRLRLVPVLVTALPKRLRAVICR